jgi:signal peptidase II
MTRKQRILLVAVIVVTGVALDHLTKLLAIHLLQDRAPIAFPAAWYPDDLFRLCFATNKGAFLSLGGNLSDSLRLILLTGVNAVILVAIAGYLASKKYRHPLLVISLALVLAGGLGNLLDRIFREGRVVVDFMNMGIRIGPISLRTGIFNIADLAIVGGLILLIAYEIFGSKQVRDPDGSGQRVPGEKRQ